MFKYKKTVLYVISFLYIILSLIELIIYFKTKQTIFGLIYLLNCILILFLLIPCVYNYNKKYNIQRISKLLIIIVFGLFNSFILQKVLLNRANYIDDSLIFINSVFVIKNILKPILYFALSIFTFFEFKIEKAIKKRINKGID